MILSDLRRELKQNSDPDTQKSSLRFFKEEIRLYGVKTATVQKIGKKFFQQIKTKTKAEIFDLCEELWQSGIQEESYVACNWSYYIRDQYEPGDFKILERWVGNYVTNWASCDTLCNHTVGSFLDMYPEFAVNLKTWARSENRWMRRGSAVSLIIPARKGRFHNNCLEIAGILLQDGQGEMLIKLLSLVNVVNEKHNDQINTGTLIRFLGEICWFPSSQR